MKWLGVAVAAVAAACSGAKPAPDHHGRVDDLDTGSDDVPLGPHDRPDAQPLPPDAAPAVDAAPTAPVTTGSADDGADFTKEAKLLYRIAACAGTDPLPDGIDAAVLDRHCKYIAEKTAEFRKTYFEGEGREFFASLVPADAPRTIVYPFGGGDLISALVAFPDATEITTISLELAGDPRRIDTMDARQLKTSLAALRVEIGGMLDVGSNTSANLSASQRNDLPAQVSSFLIALAAAGYEPIGMRYFRLADDGSIEYETADTIAQVEAAEQAASRGKRGASKRKSGWLSPNFSEAFAHVEIRYVKPGDPTVRVHRHLGWNLANDYLADHPELIKHLEAKGKVTMMTKGASYLLWYKDFSTIRDYMLAHLAWMVSDSTGIPPSFATAANMVQDTYGTFTGAFLPGAESKAARHANDFRALWKKNPKRKLPVPRFGYLDKSHHGHLVVTRPGP